jgi:hypothetical protein
MIYIHFHSMNSFNSSFPLYDIIANSINNENFSYTSEKLLKQIKQLDKEGMELLFVILRIYSIRNTKCKLLDLPFKAQKLNEKIDGITSEVSNDIKFNLCEIPEELQNMIYKFVELHLRKQSEEIVNNTDVF